MPAPKKHQPVRVVNTSEGPVEVGIDKLGNQVVAPPPPPEPVYKYEVRVRGLGIDLQGTINAENIKQIRFSIPDNVWTEVVKPVYVMLKQKDDRLNSVVLVPDARANEDKPHGPHGQPIMRRESADSAPHYLDFRQTTVPVKE